MGKIYNLKNKTNKEVIKTYKKIAIKSQILNEIWKNTGNYEKAIQVYKTYIKNNVEENE